MPQQVQHQPPDRRRPLAQTWLKLCIGTLLAAPVLMSALFFLFFFRLARTIVTLGNLLRTLGKTKQTEEVQAPQDVPEDEYCEDPRETGTAIRHMR